MKFLLDRGSDVTYSDLDSYWLGDVEKMWVDIRSSNSADLAFMLTGDLPIRGVHKWGFVPCAGFFCAASTPAAREFVTCWLQMTEIMFDDQIGLFDLLSEHATWSGSHDALLHVFTTFDLNGHSIGVALIDHNVALRSPAANLNDAIVELSHNSECVVWHPRWVAAPDVHSQLLGQLREKASGDGRKLVNKPIEKIEYYTVNGHDIAITHRGTTADHASMYQCLHQQQYECTGHYYNACESYFSSMVRGGRRPLIIDCGANIGASTLWFLARFPGSHVVAVEPARDNFALLQRNCRHCDVDLRVAGIDCIERTATLQDPGLGENAYRTITGGPDGAVAMITLSKILSDKPKAIFQPFILKVDIEGYEDVMFSGHVDEIDELPIVVVELHDWLFPGRGKSNNFFRFHLLNLLTKRDFLQRGDSSFSIAWDRITATG